MALELHLALIQTPLVWEHPEQNRKNLEATVDAISREIDVIVLPEMFTTGFTMSPEKIDKNEGHTTLIWLQKLAQRKEAAMVGSLPFFENGVYTNRLFFVEPNGTYAHYDKRHTFTLAGEDKKYQKGLNRLVVDYKGFRICPMICYDLRFPVWSRNTVDYDIIMFVANWPKPRIAAWDALLRARAIENMAYSIGVNRVGKDANNNEYPGHSAMYDALGEQVAFSKSEGVLFTTVVKEHLNTVRNKLNFLGDRDSFTLEL